VTQPIEGPVTRTEIAVVTGAVSVLIVGAIIWFAPQVVPGEPTDQQEQQQTWPFVVRTVHPEDLDR
jgi:hypothetical protein